MVLKQKCKINDLFNNLQFLYREKNISINQKDCTLFNDNYDSKSIEFQIQ